MAAKTFRRTNKQGRHEVFVVRDINKWLEELGEDFLISSIRVIHQEGPHDETLVWVNVVRFIEE